MGTHRRLGAESPILKAGFTAENLYSIFHVMALMESTQLKVTAFQFWRMLAKKKFDSIWIAQDRILDLFDTLYFSFHEKDFDSSVAASKPANMFLHNYIFKQCVEVRTHENSACAFQFLIAEQGTKLRLALSEKSAVCSKFVRVCIIANSPSEPNDVGKCILNSLLHMGADETSSQTLDMNQGTYQLFLLFQEKHLNVSVCVNSTRNLYFRGRGKLNFECSFCKPVENDWDIETIDLLPSSWSKFECSPVNIHPLLFHRLRQRSCGKNIILDVYKLLFLTHYFL
jgi:hypothetical protein